MVKMACWTTCCQLPVALLSKATQAYPLRRAAWQTILAFVLDVLVERPNVFQQLFGALIHAVYTDFAPQSGIPSLHKDFMEF